jgi:hypothetical protein
MGSDYDAFAKLAGIAAAAGRMYANDGILYAKGGTGAAAGGPGGSNQKHFRKSSL